MSGGREMSAVREGLDKSIVTATKPESSAYMIAVGLVVSLFFMWGVANNLNDILIQQFKKAFQLSDLQSGLVQSAFYTGYFVFAIPSAIFMRRFGYQRAIIFGLAVYGFGALLFYPAAELHEYPNFLIALFIVAAGLTFLETSANPFMAGLGPPETAARRLNFAQAFNPLGSITGVIIGRQFIFAEETIDAAAIAALPAAAQEAWYESAAKAVQAPYLFIGLFVIFWALLFAVIKLPKVADDDLQAKPGNEGVRALMQHSKLLFAVAAQFFYVGAQVGIWSYLIRYALAGLPDLGERGASDYLTASLIAFVVGRFAGTAIMKFVPATKLMAFYAAINSALMAVAILNHGQTGLICLVASSFFMSIMYPTIFATGIHGLGSATKTGSSLIVMAIIGGAILTAAMGYVSDIAGINVAFAVPLASFAVIFAYSRQAMTRDGVASVSVTAR